MEKIKNIVKDFKQNILLQFIGVFTFGFGVTSIINTLNMLIITNVFLITLNDLMFLLISIIGYFTTLYVLKNNLNFKEKIIDSLSFIITLFGFVLMFVPILILIETSDINIIFNCILCIISSLTLFLIKSIIKFL